MRLLADANVEAALVAWLRGQGHDVVWAMELPPGTEDRDILRMATLQNRPILTHDLDFGELVFKGRLSAPSVILMRFSHRGQSERLALLQSWWPSLERLLAQRGFIVITDNTLRSRPLPEPTETPEP